MSSICAGISHSHTLDGDLQFNHKTPTRANKNAELRFSQTPCLHLCRTVLQALLATAAGRRSAHARPWVPAKPIKKHTNAQPSSCCRLLVACCSACHYRAYSTRCLGSNAAAAGLQAAPERAHGRDRLDLTPLTSTRGAAANQPDATTPTCTRSKPTRETKIPEGKTTRFHSNQKPSEGTGEKGLHSLGITVQVFKNSWEISKPRRGEGGRGREKQKEP